MTRPVFGDIRLEWDGREYVIRSHRVMGAIARIERHITIHELGVYAERGTAPLSLLCMAFGEVLRYAGARVSDEAIYEKALEGSEQDAIANSIMALMQMVLPNSAREKIAAAAAQGEEPETADLGNLPSLPGLPGAGSKKPTKRRSPKASG